MRLLKQTIDKFISTNLQQPYNQWGETTEYSQFDWVCYNNYNYMSIVNDNKGVKPDLNTGKWLLMEVDNSFAAIDLHSHTSCIGDDTTLVNPADKEMKFSFDATKGNVLVLGGVEGEELIVKQYDSGNTLLKEDTYKVEGIRHVRSWYEYFYSPLPSSGLVKAKERDFVLEHFLPTVAKVEIVITFGSKGRAKVSSMVFGKGVKVGDTQFGVVNEVLDYSEKIVDENTGIVSIDKRDNEELMTIGLEINAIDTIPAKREIKEVLGTITMFIVDDMEKSLYEGLVILGYPEEFRVQISNQVLSTATLKIKEMI